MTVVRKLAIAAITAAIAACGGSDSPSNPNPNPNPNPTPTVNITGVAARGAPLGEANIAIRCGNSHQQVSATSVTGTFAFAVPEDAPPCIIRVFGGNPFITMFGLATAAGNTNVTPLTTLVTARAMMMGTGETSFNVFFAQGAIDLAPLVAELDDAEAQLLSDLEAAGFVFPADFDPMRGSFDAVPGDGHDFLLELFATALEDAGQTLEQFMAAWLGGGAVPAVPDSEGAGPTEADAISALDGTYDVEMVYAGEHARGTVTIGVDNSIDFDTDLLFSAADADAAIVYDWIDCCNRIDVDYGAGGYLRMSLTEGGDLRDMYLELTGGDIVVSLLEPLDEGTSDGSLLEGNGIIGTIENVLRVQEAHETQEGVTPFLTSANGRFSLAGVGVTPVWTIIGVPGEIGVHYCSPTQNGIGITFRASPAGEAGGAIGRVGRCTITVTDVTLDASDNVTSVEGQFAVELLTRTGFFGSTSGNDVAIVTDGYFRYTPEE